MIEEEQEKTEKQKEVNIIGLMKNPDEFRKMFQELRHMAGERLQLHQFESAIEYYLKCLDMMELGKHLLVHSSAHTRACLFASLAAAYQGAWKIQKCHKYCEKAQQEIQRIISVDQKEQFLKLSKLYVTLKFQHCAILSQLNNHEKALETCKSTLVTLEQAINIISDFSKKQEESLNAKCNEEGVMFSRKVHGLAGQILSTLHQQLTEKVQIKQSKSSSFYFWEKNPQKNEDQLKRSFLPQNNNSHTRRSILGVNKQNHWVDEFNIGSIMRMGEVKPQAIQRSIPMEQYLFKDKLYELVIQCSLAFFTIATEMRFIDSEKNGEDEDTALNKLDTIKKKYGYEEKSQLFKLSQAYHLRSIEIISANIQAPIPFLSHMIKSYDKHYVFKKKLEEIVAYDESMIEPSSIINNPNNVAKTTDATKNVEQVEKAYGQQIITINRQATEGESEEYENEYLNHVPRRTVKREDREEVNHKRIDKVSRNTIKLFQSLQRDSAKERPKSAGKVRKARQAKEENTQKHIHNFTSPHKTKRKAKGHKQQAKDDKTKKGKIRFTQMDGEGELHVRTKSSTHIKFVFKKKK